MRALNSRYAERSGYFGNSGPVGLLRSISLVAAILACFGYSAFAEAAPKTEWPDHAMTAFMVGNTLGEAYITAQYEGGFPASLKMGVLKDQLRNRGSNCLDSLIGEIDGIIQRLRTARTNQQAMNIVSEFRHAAANRAWNYCGCKQIVTEFYDVAQPPYGGGRYCLTEKEAADFRAKGAVVRPSGQRCNK